MTTTLVNCTKARKEDGVQMGWVDSIFYQIIKRSFLLRFKKGLLRIIFPDGTSEVFGDDLSDLQVDFTVHNPRLFRRFVTGESIGLVESYMDGDWSTPDLAAFTHLVIEQDKAKVQVGIPILKKVKCKLTIFTSWLFRNTRATSLTNVQEHYDIGNEMYKLFLDESTMSYTCALYRDPDSRKPHFIAEGQFQDADCERMCEKISLDQAQLNKIHFLIKKAGIKKHHRVLELGCGFGGFSGELARLVGCKVDCYNLSVQQLALARERAKSAGTAHLINYMHDDYRNCVDYRLKNPFTVNNASSDGYDKEGDDSDLVHVSQYSKTGLPDPGPIQYDAIVSIGMLEHVGHYDLPTFFETCDRSLKPNGTLVVHTITHSDSTYEQHRATYGFIQKYIFPGACIPAVGAIVDAAVWNTTFELQHFENIGEHYACTLRHWRENFYKNLDKIAEICDPKTKAPMYDAAFARMWDFYLCDCEAEFISGHLGLGHFVFKRPARDYRSQAQSNRTVARMKSLSHQATEEAFNQPRQRKRSSGTVNSRKK